MAGAGLGAGRRCVVKASDSICASASPAGVEVECRPSLIVRFESSHSLTGRGEDRGRPSMQTRGPASPMASSCHRDAINSSVRRGTTNDYN